MQHYRWHDMIGETPHVLTYLSIVIIVGGGVQLCVILLMPEDDKEINCFVRDSLELTEINCIVLCVCVCVLRQHDDRIGDYNVDG